MMVRLQPISLRFGILPAEKQKAMVTLTPDDLILERDLPSGQLHVHGTSRLANRLGRTYKATGGLVAMEGVAPVLKAFMRRENFPGSPEAAFRQFTVDLAEKLARVIPFMSGSPTRGYEAFAIKAAYDPDRRATNHSTRHIHHGHFDPHYYQMIGIADGPFVGIPPRMQNRFVMDAEEVKQFYDGKLPNGFGFYKRYPNPEEKRQFGIELDSHQGSLVFHDRRRFLHWTEGNAGSRDEDWKIIDDYDHRDPEDQTRTPYGFFGFVEQQSDRSRYNRCVKKYEQQREAYLAGTYQNTKPEHNM